MEAAAAAVQMASFHYRWKMQRCTEHLLNYRLNNDSAKKWRHHTSFHTALGLYLFVIFFRYISPSVWHSLCHPKNNRWCHRRIIGNKTARRANPCVMHRFARTHTWKSCYWRLEPVGNWMGADCCEDFSFHFSLEDEMTSMWRTRQNEERDFLRVQDVQSIDQWQLYTGEAVEQWMAIQCRRCATKP